MTRRERQAFWFLVVLVLLSMPISISIRLLSSPGMVSDETSEQGPGARHETPSGDFSRTQQLTWTDPETGIRYLLAVYHTDGTLSLTDVGFARVRAEDTP